MIICTYTVNCDVCGKFMKHETHALLPDPALPIPLPERNKVAGMDLCKDCAEQVIDALHAVIEPIQQATVCGRRSS